ncbi:unnamed protein product [Protopolystoma xenopodis]|uniref:Secreted protein n=1 Tax=Protopolystoma xenopodis TaxID=117903 RepID=A0A3S5BCL7_9PLAT|nr:unnamed protein product [Protopolystoma xenopodis]
MSVCLFVCTKSAIIAAVFSCHLFTTHTHTHTHTHTYAATRNGSELDNNKSTCCQRNRNGQFRRVWRYSRATATVVLWWSQRLHTSPTYRHTLPRDWAMRLGVSVRPRRGCPKVRSDQNGMATKVRPDDLGRGGFGDERVEMGRLKVGRM